MSQQVIVNSFAEGIGPICILLDTSTQQTILDLKKHVTQRTSIPTTFLCIKNLSGRSLKDQDSIFVNDKEKQGGPIVFNIKIITSWKPPYTSSINNNNHLSTEQQQQQQQQQQSHHHISKYIRQDIDPSSIPNNNSNNNNNNINMNINNNINNSHGSLNNNSNHYHPNINMSATNPTTTTLTFRAATMFINKNDDNQVQKASIKGKSKETRKRKSCN